MSTPTIDFATFSKIHQQGLEAAQQATAEYFRCTLGGQDCWPCGFAWVTVYGVKLNTKLGKTMKAFGFKKAYEGGIQLWNPSGSYVQNMDAKESGARAYAKVLRDHGLQAYSGTRMD